MNAIQRTEAGLFADLTTTSGVALRIRPFSFKFHQDTTQAAEEKFPSDETRRNQWLSEKLLAFLLDFCVEVDLEPWAQTIQKLERYAGPYPEDPFDRRARFLMDYALGTEAEYVQVLTLSLQLMNTRSEP